MKAVGRAQVAERASRARVAPYVPPYRRRLHWSRAAPPPLEMPAEVEPDESARRLWRVAAMWWRDHFPRPYRDGEACAVCKQWWPCSAVVSAEDILVCLLERCRRRLRRT